MSLLLQHAFFLYCPVYRPVYRPVSRRRKADGSSYKFIALEEVRQK